MNKRKEPITARMQKKEDKEVRKGMKEGDTILPKKTKAINSKSLKEKVEVKHEKKTSKRTSTNEKIEGSSPAHIHVENERWSFAVTRQNLLKANRLRKKMTKNPRSLGR